jgi:NitT/TauT family transport system substrate-binding protein
MTTGAVVAQAVAGGAIDIGYSALTALIVGHVRNIPFVLIAPAGMYQTASPIGSMLVRKDSSLATGRDFAGKTIGAPTLLDVSAIVSSAWVDQTGGNSKSLKFVEVPNPLLLPALLDGRIDAFTSVDPWVTRALDSGEVRVLAKSFDSIAPSFLITSWFSNTAFVEKNRDLVERFARVLREAAVDANAHRAEIVSLIASYTKLDPTMIARTLKDSNASYLDPKTIQPMIDILAKYHVIEKGFDARDLISTTALSPGK